MEELELQDLRKKAEAGSTMACSVLGIAYLYGRELPKNYAEALRYLTFAADKGASRAMYNLALIFEDGLGVPQNLERAFELHQRSAKRGEFLAQIRVARMFRDGRGTILDTQASRKWYRQALEQAGKIDAPDLIAEAREYISRAG